VLLPKQGIGWQAHVGGLAGGVLAGWLLRDRRAWRVRKTARVSAASGSAGTAALPATGTRSSLPAPATGSQAAKQGRGGGKDLAIDPSNPRAELYKQLGDMGL